MIGSGPRSGSEETSWPVRAAIFYFDFEVPHEGISVDISRLVISGPDNWIDDHFRGIFVLDLDDVLHKAFIIIGIIFLLIRNYFLHLLTYFIR